MNEECNIVSVCMDGGSEMKEIISNFLSYSHFFLLHFIYAI